MTAPREPSAEVTTLEARHAGVAASPGIAIGRALILEPAELEVEERDISAGEIEAEVERFQRAVVDAREELKQLRDTTALALGESEAAIFDAHLSVLSDPMAIDDTIGHIRRERRNAEFLFRRNLNRVADTLESHGGPYFADRAQDILDVKRRVIRRLLNIPRERWPQSAGPGIIVARELSPSEAAQLNPDRVLGVAVDLGGRTSHVAIMARARGIPAVVGLANLSTRVAAGVTLVVDGLRGVAVTNPSAATLARYRTEQERFRETEERFETLAALPAVTKDGREVVLAANLEMPEEADIAVKRGARGCGLFRTEFFFMRHPQFPSEEEQYVAFREVTERMAPYPVIIRTLDVGGDKFASYLDTSREDNPFLGMRGIRFLREHEEVFHRQIRAAYRASAHGRVKIMLPMISGLEEVRAAGRLCQRVRTELTAEGVAFDPDVEVGVMVEVPSAVMLADVLAREVSFFSIGSNDLIQYTLAVDRGSARVAHLYEPLHPAVLRSIRQTVEAGHRQGRWVGLCGEMASDPTALVLLIGLGVDELSVGASFLPEVKRIVRDVRFADARKWAEDALEMATATEVRDYMTPIMRREFPEIDEDGAGGDPAARSRR